MASRSIVVWRRYGQRSPFVVCELMRRALLSYYLRVLWLTMLSPGPKGKRLYIGKGFVISPGGYLAIGHNTIIRDDVCFEISVRPLSKLRIGSEVWISNGCVLACASSIVIGNDVRIGEYVSIRDGTHKYKNAGIPIRLQGDEQGTVDIDDDVWIGRGSLIQAKNNALHVGKGSVIAANSVVTKSVPENEVWGGAPARFLKARGYT